MLEIEVSSTDFQTAIVTAAEPILGPRKHLADDETTHLMQIITTTAAVKYSRTRTKVNVRK